MSRGTPKEALDPAETAWMDDANCLGVVPDLFFPDRGGYLDVVAGKQVCAGCVVRDDCLTYAVEHGESYGIWGGLSQRELRRLRRWWRPGMALPPINLQVGGAGRPRKVAS